MCYSRQASAIRISEQNFPGLIGKRSKNGGRMVQEDDPKGWFNIALGHRSNESIVLDTLLNPHRITTSNGCWDMEYTALCS